mmetsp:Transcript_98998/g.263025  ORF Transcript_98998/g.263025 Transcript_98998/m.263025 type:complete len:228 (+) Transcript_98998:139-822(+)
MGAAGASHGLTSGCRLEPGAADVGRGRAGIRSLGPRAGGCGSCVTSCLIVQAESGRQVLTRPVAMLAACRAAPCEASRSSCSRGGLPSRSGTHCGVATLSKSLNAHFCSSSQQPSCSSDSRAMMSRMSAWPPMVMPLVCNCTSLGSLKATTGRPGLTEPVAKRFWRRVPRLSSATRRSSSSARASQSMPMTWIGRPRMFPARMSPRTHSGSHRLGRPPVSRYMTSAS